MLIVTNAGTDKLQLTTDAAVDVDVTACYLDIASDGSGNPTPGRQLTAINTATTTDIVATPGASTARNVTTLHIRNKHASSSVTVTVIYDANGTDKELHKVVLKPGESLEYIEGIGFYVLRDTARVDVCLSVASDIVKGTTGLADVTGLTYPVKSGKKYAFECHLYHISAASTTGAQFAVNGPGSPTILVAANNSGVTNSVTAGAISLGSATALDTVITAQTTGSANITLTILSGFIQPSADGTFAIRFQPEVAANLTIKAGSWLKLREVDA